MVELIIPDADEQEFDILYHSELREIDEESVYSAYTDDEDEDTHSSSTDEEQ